MENDCRYEGWVMKKSWISNWNRRSKFLFIHSPPPSYPNRYFTIRGTLLYYGKTNDLSSCHLLTDLSCKGSRIEINSLLSRNTLTLWNGEIKLFSFYGETDRENTRWAEMILKVITQHQHTILYEGFILKKGSFVKNWKARYGVLTAEGLVYYAYRDKTESYTKKGEILFDPTTTIHLLPDTKAHPNRFSITTRLPSSGSGSAGGGPSRQSSRILYISVLNHERREEWVTALREAISQQFSTSQHRLSAFALLSDHGHGQPGWMNAMFEDDYLASSPPQSLNGVPFTPIRSPPTDSPPDTFYDDRISSE
jgi:hypothetical protein